MKLVQPTADYSEFQEKAKPSDAAFTALNALVEEAKQLQGEINEYETQLELKKIALRDVLWSRLPTLCDSMGLAEFTTSAGLKVKVSEEIHANVSEDRRLAAHKWMEDNGHGGLIKREINVSFTREEQVAADKLLKELEGRFAGLSQKKSVHAQTLKAWVREMLSKGKSVPLDIFGVRRIRIAKIPDVKVEAADKE